MLTVVGWSHPPRPVELIPSFDPSASHADKAKAVIYDFYHDDDLRNALAVGAGGRGPWIISGGVPLEQIDRVALYELYLSPEQFAKDYGAAGMTGAQIRAESWFQNFIAAVDLAIAKRSKLGPLPPNEYGDPVVIYYYDNDWVKKVVYPRASISTASGMALDPANMQWWKGNGIGTFQRDPNTLQWGDEGFDFNKDIAGNISTIIQVIVTAIGAVLVATGVGAAAGAVFLAWGAALAAWGGVIDAALTGGDVGKASVGFLNAIVKLGGVETAQLPSGMTKTLLQGSVKMLNSFAPALSHAQAQGMSFSQTAETLKAQAAKMGTVNDQRVSQLAALSGAASHVLLSGYTAGQVTDSLTLEGASSLIPDDGARTLFQLGAYLGVLKTQQAKVGSTDVSPQGTQPMPPQALSAQQSLSRLVMQLGAKYGLGAPPWTVFMAGHPDYATASHVFSSSHLGSITMAPAAAQPAKSGSGIPLTASRL